MVKGRQTCDCSIIHTDKVNEILGVIPGNAYFDDISAFFKILGDSTRSKIIFALQRNELCVCDIANILSMTKSSVSHQLAKMREFGVVKCRRDGKEVFYSLDDDHVSFIFSATEAHIAHKLREAVK